MEHPRGIWIWRIANISSDYLTTLVQKNVKRVYLKCFDGKSNPMFWGFQCKPEIIQSCKDKGIEVFGWGYHYGTDNVDDQVSAVKQAITAGIDGYILDIEVEAKKPSTHPHILALLTKLRPLFTNGNLGYTSLGNPAFHTQIPWKMLDDNCDIAMPQIYFEKFTFKPTSEEEVQACLDAHRAMNLVKPIMPIWGSESDTASPAGASELQTYLNRFPGSSVWRVPNVGERGEALKLDYAGAPAVVVGTTSMPSLPILRRILKLRCLGTDVTALQKALTARGFDTKGIDGDFGPDTEKAVRAFQLQAALTVDGEVGPDTWALLGGNGNVPIPEQGKLAQLADLARVEADKGLSWNNKNDEAEKYLQPFREPMRLLGHLGSQPVFFNWCAAFVTWCCRETGIAIPDQPEGFWATMALVESWKFWAQKNGFWHSANGFTPKRGDILVFEWFDGDAQLDHIGIVRGYAPGSETIQTSEGNRGNVAKNGNRELSNVMGYIRIVE
jgi:hypothetical protein